MRNLQRTSYRLSFVDVTLQGDALRFDVVHSAMGDTEKSPKNWRSRRCTSHAWRSAFIVQRTETVLYNTLPGNFGVRFFVCVARFIFWGARFQLLASAWRFEMIENGSRLARKWRIKAGIEPNRLVSWLKCERRLAVAQLTPQTQKKAHAQPVAGEFDAHTHAWDWK